MLIQFPQGLGTGIISYALGYIWLLWKGCLYKVQRGLNWLEIESLSSFLRVKSNQRATSLPCLFSPSPSYTNFEIAIVFSIVRRSDKKKLGSTRPHRAGVVSYVPGVYMVLMKGMLINFREGSFDWKLKVLDQFLRVSRYLRTTSPHSPFFPSNTNFEIAIFLE